MTEQAHNPTNFQKAIKSRLVAGFSGTGLAYFW